MHELLQVWTNRKGVRLIAINAIIYALLLIPFNEIQWTVEGIPVRPAAAIPVVCGIFFGPAAAWGLGIGNLIGDVFDPWSLMSVVGFLINFIYPYGAYLLWHRIMRDRDVTMDASALVIFWIVTLVMTFVSMFLLAAAGTLFFNRPFESGFIGYYTYSILLAMLAGPLIFRGTFEWIVRHGHMYGKQWERYGPLNQFRWTGR
jgi:energy-coupling factor transport system substrate-specific component